MAAESGVPWADGLCRTDIGTDKAAGSWLFQTGASCRPTSVLAWQQGPATIAGNRNIDDNFGNHMNATEQWKNQEEAGEKQAMESSHHVVLLVFLFVFAAILAA